MTLRKASIAYHPVFGPMPAWAVSRWLSALMLVNALGMGLGGLWFALVVCGFEFPTSRPWLWAQAGAVFAMLLGGLFGCVYNSAVALWQWRLRKPEMAPEV